MTIKLRNTIIFCLIAIVIGFLLGRFTFTPKTSVKVKESVKYVPSPYVISSNIPNYKLVPYRVSYTDTIIQCMTQEVDTAEILKDYFLSRQYELDFSNDSIGIFKVDAEVNQNKLVSASSHIQPMVKTIYRDRTETVYKSPSIQFYGMLGTSLDFKTNKISLGVDLKQRYLIGVSGIRFDDKYSYTIDFGIKF